MRRALDAAVSAYLDKERRALGRVSGLVGRVRVVVRQTAQALARAMGIWL